MSYRLKALFSVIQKKPEIKVLLIDDEKVFAETLSQRLQSRIFITDTVHDGNETPEFVD